MSTTENRRDHFGRALTCLDAGLPLPDDPIVRVVHIHPNAAAYEVEFVTLTGLTVAVVRVLPIRLRPVSRRDLTYVRELTPSKRAG